MHEKKEVLEGLKIDALTARGRMLLLCNMSALPEVRFAPLFPL